MELPVVQLKSADILLAAVHRLEFLVALKFRSNPGDGNRKPEYQRRHKNHQGEQDIAFLLPRRTPGTSPSSHLHLSVMLMVCVRL